MSIDVTAAVNLHREGSAALPSMISAWRSVEHARAHGINAELLLVLDRSDDSTTRVADRWTSRGARVVHVDVGDLGAARNRAVATCGDSEWIAFLDADDLWGEYWLTAAYTAVLESGGESQHDVWHPAVNIIFGDHHSLLHHVDSSDASFSWARFRLHNQWTALSFVRRSTIEDIPYPRNDLASGFGFEDWSWNEEVLRRGGRHRVVADTCHFIHRSSNPSLLSQSQHALRTPYTSDNTTEFRRPTPAARTEVPGTSETHRIAEIELGEAVRAQIRLGATIEPRILQTVRPDVDHQTLPQNFQMHVTPAHLALEELDGIAANTSPTMSVGDLLDASTRLPNLPSEQRVRVVAEVLLDPELSDRQRGDSPLISEAVEHFPQLG